MGKLACYCLIGITLVCFGFADSALKQKSRELHKVDVNISGLQKKLAHAENKKQTLIRALKDTEINIGNLANDIRRTHKNLSFEKYLLDELNQKQIHYQRQLEKQTALLAEEVRAAYMLGSHQYLKLLLNQQDPNALSRLIMYYHYINALRIKVIKNLNNTITSMAANAKDIHRQTNQYASLFEKEQHQNLMLEQKNQQRKEILTKLNQTIKTRTDKLTTLKTNREKLQNLILKLKKTAEISKSYPKISFDHVKGKLHWPTKGVITKDFGYEIDASGTTFNGVFLSAPAGQPVYAIYPGKVVFADWLRGVGLLVIIQHGKHFMSLYGHDHALLVKTGQWVKQGQQIATVGKSGGYEKTGLFFQIRDDGRPLNPHKWCS